MFGCGTGQNGRTGESDPGSRCLSIVFGACGLGLLVRDAERTLLLTFGLETHPTSLLFFEAGDEMVRALETCGAVCMIKLSRFGDFVT